jgi:hypothetical protein
MNFREAQAQWQRLSQDRNRGKLSPAQFETAIAQLRVQDSQGIWWQMESRGTWLRWTGNAWLPATPQELVSPPAVPIQKPPIAAQPPAVPIQQARPPAAPLSRPQPPAVPKPQPPAVPGPAPAPSAVTPAQPADPLIQAFREADAKATQLRAQRNAKRLTPEAFTQALSGIRVQDHQNRTWQPDPVKVGWIVWEGGKWTSAMPPVPGAASAVEDFKKKLMDPKTFLDVARRMPLRQRPQGWWDLLGILAGMGSGWLWFVYGSVRGFPYPAFMKSIQRDQWTDFIPAIGLLLVPLVLFLARRTIAKLVSPIFTKLQSIPLPAKIALLLFGAGILWLFTSPNPILGWAINFREGLDWVTPVLMTALPMLFVFLRKELDQALMPLQSFKRHIPKLVLLGIGIALPFLSAWLMYKIGISQYPLLRMNTVVGLVLSYAVVRTPQSWPGMKPPSRSTMTTIIILLIIFAAASTPGFADDFLRDPFNLQDGLRTDGVAPVLAGISTAIVSVFVNGVEVAQVMIQSPTPVGEGEQAEHKQFVVQIHTVGKDGAPSTKIDADNDSVYVYAHCEEVGKGRFPAGDATLHYALGSADGWVTLQDMGTQNGERCALVRKADTEPGGPPPDTCLITVTSGAGTSTPVALSLSFSGLEIRWNVEPTKYQTESGISLPAKQDTEMTLNVWAMKREADGSENVDWDVDFTHMEMSEPDGVPASVFGMRDEPTEGRQEKTVWTVKNDLPCPEFQKDLPANCGIRVRVWKPQGTIIRHGFSSIDVNGAEKKGEITIPVTLEDPPASMELLSPKMPIAADEANSQGGVEVKLRVTAQFASGVEPLKNADINWAIAQKGEKPPLGGRFDTDTGKTDEKGEITFTYYPPELFYKPGGYFFEDLEVFKGAPGGKAPKKLGTERLYLSPAISFKLKAEKKLKLDEGEFGVAFEEEGTEVNIAADECATAISITPRLEWEAASGDGHANLAHTRLFFTFWDGKADIEEKPANPYETPDNGTLRRAFPELAKNGNKEYTLEPDTEAPLAAFNPMAEQALDQYESNLEQWAPEGLLSASVVTGLKNFRDDYAHRMAAMPEEDLGKLHSALRLLECAATHTHIYNELYSNMVKVAVDQGVKIISALVGMLISYFNVGEKVLGYIGKKLVEKGKGFTGWIWEKIGNRLRDGLVKIALWLNAQIPKLRITGSGKTPSAFDQFIDKMEAEANRLAPMLDVDSPMFVQGLMGYFKLLIHYMAGYFMYTAGSILTRMGTRVVAKISGMLFLQSGKGDLTNYLGKVIEDKLGQGFGYVCDYTTGAVTSANSGVPGGHGDLNKALNFLAPSLDEVLAKVLDKARKADVPLDYKPRLENMKQGLTSLREYSHGTELEVIESDLNTEWWDWLVWAVDWFIIAVVSLCSLGIGSAEASAATRAIDIAWGLLQAAMRGTGSFATTMGLSTGIIAHFELQTLDLVDLQP